MKYERDVLGKVEFFFACRLHSWSFSCLSPQTRARRDLDFCQECIVLHVFDFFAVSTDTILNALPSN